MGFPTFSFGMMISTSSSSDLSTVLRGPTKKSASGSCRRPAVPAIVTIASSATKRRAAVHRRHGGHQVAAKRAEIARLHRANGVGRVDERRKQVADDRRAHDLGVRDQRADTKALVGHGDCPQVVWHARCPPPRSGRGLENLRSASRSVPPAMTFTEGAVLSEQRHGIAGVLGGVEARMLSSPFSGCLSHGKAVTTESDQDDRFTSGRRP